MLNHFGVKAARGRQQIASAQIERKEIRPEVAPYEDRARPWIDEVDREYAFDFSGWGDDAEEVQNELDGALECVGELAPLVAEMVKVAADAEAAKVQAEQEAERLYEVATDLDNLASEAQIALEQAGDAVAQLQQRLVELGSAA